MCLHYIISQDTCRIYCAYLGMEVIRPKIKPSTLLAFAKRVFY